MCVAWRHDRVIFAALEKLRKIQKYSFFIEIGQNMSEK